MQSQIITPFTDAVFQAAQLHIRHVRNMFAWPGLPYHDVNYPDHDRFNRWFWHNLPTLKELHHSPELIAQVSELVGEPVKPSYVFLSMYGKDGICPPHTDRPQCKYTVDIVFDQDAVWPIYVGDTKETPIEECKAYSLQVGKALLYSGTDQRHYRKRMGDDSKASFCDLAFFHFVPTSWMGALE